MYIISPNAQKANGLDSAIQILEQARIDQSGVYLPTSKGLRVKGRLSGFTFDIYKTSPADLIDLIDTLPQAATADIRYDTQDHKTRTVRSHRLSIRQSLCSKLRISWDSRLPKISELYREITGYEPTGRIIDGIPEVRVVTFEDFVQLYLPTAKTPRDIYDMISKEADKRSADQDSDMIPFIAMMLLEQKYALNIKNSSTKRFITTDK